MYSQVIEDADATLTTNRRVRAYSADLRAQSNALLFEFRRHRFFSVSGGSDAADDECVRSLLRKFCATHGTPTSYAGFSSGSVCQSCGSTIKAGAVEYDLVTSTAELRVDGACYAVFIAVRETAAGAAAL